MPTKASALAILALLAPLTLASPALAAGDGDKPTADKDKDKDKDAKKDDEAKKDDGPKAEGSEKYDPYEDPTKTYRFIGLRFRDAVAPKFIINWFADGGRNVNVPMVGPEFITRRDHLEIAVALMYADYSMDPFLFKGKSDPATSYEFAASSLKLGYLMVDIQYEIPLEKKGDKTGRFALLIGGGVGIAGVFGSLYRSQVYPNKANADPGDPSQWSACKSKTDGMTTAGKGFCNNPSDNQHYWPGWSSKNRTQPGKGAFSDPYWSAGGSKPLIFPWLAVPQISFRYKPIKQLQMKADAGFSTSGFFFGLSAGYGL